MGPVPSNDKRPEVSVKLFSSIEAYVSPLILQLESIRGYTYVTRE